MPSLTWKAVFLIWLMALPVLGGAGYFAYQKYPEPFHVAAAWGQKGLALGQKAWHDYQAAEAAKKAKAEAEAKAADEDQASGGGWQ